MKALHSTDLLSSENFPRNFEAFMKYIEIVRIGDEELYRIAGTTELHANLAICIALLKQRSKKDLVIAKPEVTVISKPAANQPQGAISKFSQRKASATAAGKVFYNNYTRKVAKERGCSLEEARAYIDSKKSK